MYGGPLQQICWASIFNDSNFIWDPLGLLVLTVLCLCLNFSSCVVLLPRDKPPLPEWAYLGLCQWFKGCKPGSEGEGRSRGRGYWLCHCHQCHPIPSLDPLASFPHSLTCSSKKDTSGFATEVGSTFLKKKHFWRLKEPSAGLTRTPVLEAGRYKETVPSPAAAQSWRSHCCLPPTPPLKGTGRSASLPGGS